MRLSYRTGNVAHHIVKLWNYAATLSGTLACGIPMPAFVSWDDIHQTPVTWLSWPWLGLRLQFVFFDLPTLGVAVGVMSVGMLAAGLLLRRPDDALVPGETVQK